MEPYTKYYKAVGVTVQINSDFRITENTFHSKFSHFETIGPGNDNAIINHHFSLPPNLKHIDHSNHKLITDDGIWKIMKSDSSYFYQYDSKEDANFKYKVIAEFNAEHTIGNIYFSGISESQYKNLELVSITGLGTDQVLYSHLMVNREGFIFHSNGINIDGKSILFSGKSGAGKSTISGILKKKGAEIFCDDRIIIQKHLNDFMASGSWIHPGVTSESNCTQKLYAVFFIEQAKNNSIEPINGIVEKNHRAMKSLVKNFFLKKQWDTTLGLIYDFVKQVPFYKLKFDLTGKIYPIISDEIKIL